MNDTLQERIRERLAIVGKSATAASVEAGLGRSVVQEILSGSTASPRVLTLEKIAKVLDCSLEYPLGFETEDPENTIQDKDKLASLVVQLRETAIALEVGVFRHNDVNVSISIDEGICYRDARYPNDQAFLCLLKDDSMADLCINTGDVLMCASNYVTGPSNLVNDNIVIVSRSIVERHLIEYSARQVRLVGEDVEFICRNAKRNIPPICVPGKTIEAALASPYPSLLKLDDGTMVTVVGTAVRASRKLAANRE